MCSAATGRNASQTFSYVSCEPHSLSREFEKFAVRVGGGTNHRFSLKDAVMIKDNHLMGSSNLKKAVNNAANNAANKEANNAIFHVMNTFDIFI